MDSGFVVKEGGIPIIIFQYKNFMEDNEISQKISKNNYVNERLEILLFLKQINWVKTWYR